MYRQTITIAFEETVFPLLTILCLDILFLLKYILGSVALGKASHTSEC
jgi:hypothetical protein